MRILFVWITAITLIFSITVGWYISQDLVVNLAHNMLSGVTGEAANLVDLIEFMNIIWGPLFDILVLLWAFASSNVNEVMSGYRSN